jgi:iron(III) transport system ATP-binding protein
VELLTQDGQAFLAIEELTKRFGDILAVDRLSLGVRAGELFTLLGPSGCGKTTVLRLIAGLERPDRGEIRHGSRTIVSVRGGIFVEPEHRGVGMVFQSYALWPHMTVFENVAFPLRLRRLPAASVEQKTRAVLRLVGLDQVERRPAPFLSGGQQQRVALARALVYEPEILLLDEPFSNLDARLREQMAAELKTLQARLRLTTVYVTHDQSEALALSDRIAVMNEGRLEQIARPAELYERPRTAFVRDFVGLTVLLEGRVASVDMDGATVDLTGAGGRLAGVRSCLEPPPRPGERVRLGIRPEEVEIVDTAADGALPGTIETVAFSGDRMTCVVSVGEERLVAFVRPDRGVQQGSSVFVRVPPSAVTVWRT